MARDDAHWTGRECSECNGCGEKEDSYHGRMACGGCGGTGEWHATWQERAERAEAELKALGAFK